MRKQAKFCKKMLAKLRKKQWTPSDISKGKWRVQGPCAPIAAAA
jgi:hypothetical protein